jgi:hypothetical protein
VNGRQSSALIGERSRESGWTSSSVVCTRPGVQDLTATELERWLVGEGLATTSAGLLIPTARAFEVAEVLTVF